jgi:hypothetical protein
MAYFSGALALYRRWHCGVADTDHRLILKAYRRDDFYQFQTHALSMDEASLLNVRRIDTESGQRTQPANFHRKEDPPNLKGMSFVS